MTVISSFRFYDVDILVLPIEERLKPQVELLFSKLKEEYPKVNFQIDSERKNGIGYYQTLCFTINATNTKGEKVHLTDGGITDWTQQLLSNKKERYMISAIGSERVGLMFYGGD